MMIPFTPHFVKLKHNNEICQVIAMDVETREFSFVEKSIPIEELDDDDDEIEPDTNKIENTEIQLLIESEGKYVWKTASEVTVVKP